MRNYEWIGWLSSVVLILTIGKQIHKEWKLKSARDISSYLFIGQVGAEFGFVVYSLLLRNWVFLSVNLLLLIENIVGLFVTIRIKGDLSNEYRKSVTSGPHKNELTV